MITYKTGNLFDSDAEALVNTVNTIGVMGKGIALQFKKLYPDNYKKYSDACKKGLVRTGQLFVTEDHNILSGKKIIINFPTKEHWRNPSKYEYIESGVLELIKLIKERSIKSVAIPPLGSGNGGLKWFKVKEILESALLGLKNCDIYIYEPNYAVKEVLKKERAKLTPARALLVYMLIQGVKQGEFASEFMGEKTCYFLQRFGGEEYLKLNFKEHYYGPYSGKVRHVLYYLNGSYLTGYGDKDKKPFENLSILMDSEKEVVKYINSNEELKSIACKTKTFLDGYYSEFGLELLSSIDFLIQKLQTTDFNKIKVGLEGWSNRKRSKFSNDKFIHQSIEHIKNASLV